MKKPVKRTRPAPSPARRQRLLEAAERQFSSAGFRAVSMAAIADEAGFAKATIYAYFADKDDVFRAVAASVAERLIAAVDGGLAGSGSTGMRLVAALRAKDTLVYKLVTASSHAGELFEARDRLVRSLFSDTDNRILERVAGALADGRERGLPPARLARILVRASRGLAARAESAHALGKDIEFLVSSLVDGCGLERTPAPTASGD